MEALGVLPFQTLGQQPCAGNISSLSAANHTSAYSLYVPCVHSRAASALLTPLHLPVCLCTCLCSYTHGGYELLLNSYLVTYFNNSWKGQTAAACHSLEVRSRHLTCMHVGCLTRGGGVCRTASSYIKAPCRRSLCYYSCKALGVTPTFSSFVDVQVYLHLLDNTRDIALVNKSMSVLTNDVEPRIPEGWWDPVPHKGLEKTADGKWRRNDALVRHNTPPPSLHRA